MVCQGILKILVSPNFECVGWWLEGEVYCFESCLNIVHLTMSLKGRDSIRRLPGHCDRLAGRDLYRATPAVTRDLGLCGLTLRTPSPFPRSVQFLCTASKEHWRCISTQSHTGTMGGFLLSFVSTCNYEIDTQLVTSTYDL